MLTGEAKKEYQRDYMRDYMRRRRGVKTPLRPDVKTLLRPTVKPNTPRADVIPDVKPNREVLRAKLRAVGYDLDGNILRRNGRKVQTLTDEQVESYGELDADGNNIPDYS